ncbi:hypothetical protein COLO4_13990 [Corchorus olitorius]|uniref:Uncharacterized protein n=1 Tax=Corchorus olitorius TaxID=93759 RepID=A0A1R3JTV7_9ROSI|nr:hypothetical protein COLO4_13990 [Corchorus olitorius]
MSLIAKLASIMLLLVAVQAQEFFPSSSSEDSSLLSEFEFPQDFNSPPAHVTNQFSLETQSDDADQNSVFSESESPQDSEDTDFPLETQEFPMETDSHSEKRSPLPSPPPPKKAPSPWRSEPFTPRSSCKVKCATKCKAKDEIHVTKATEYVNHCYNKCVMK